LTLLLRLLRFIQPSPRGRDALVSSGGGLNPAMDLSERRQLTRYTLRTPIRFRAVGLASDKTEHFTEALNISRGGSLVQDIPTKLPEMKVAHASKDGWQKGFNKHEVRFAKLTRLKGIYGIDSLSVPTSHHQCVDKPGEDLVVAATTDAVALKTCLICADSVKAGPLAQKVRVHCCPCSVRTFSMF